MTRVEQRKTSAYHTQSSELCQWRNLKIKDTLNKVLEEKVDQWPYVTDVVLFAYGVSRHAATKYMKSLMT